MPFNISHHYSNRLRNHNADNYADDECDIVENKQPHNDGHRFIHLIIFDKEPYAHIDYEHITNGNTHHT